MRIGPDGHAKRVMDSMETRHPMVCLFIFFIFIYLRRTISWGDRGAALQPAGR